MISVSTSPLQACNINDPKFVLLLQTKRHDKREANPNFMNERNTLEKFWRLHKNPIATFLGTPYNY